MLKSFVDEDKYNFLIKLLTDIHEDKLRQTASIVILRGGPSSGKSTLVQIMEKLAPSSCRKCFGDIGIRSNAKEKSVAEWNSSLIIFSELSSTKDHYDTLKKYHQVQKEIGPISLYHDQSLMVNFNPGVFVVCVNDDQSYNFQKMKRNPAELTLPNKFKFKNEVSPTLVDDCVAEFVEIYNQK